MKFDDKTIAGSAFLSASRRMLPLVVVVTAGLLLVGGLANGQSMYKYKGPDGEWIYTDVAPPAETTVETRDLHKGESDPKVTVQYHQGENGVEFVARNEYHAPVEVILALDKIANLSAPPPKDQLRWVVPARSQLLLMELALLDDSAPPVAEFRYVWLHGDPDSQHAPAEPYRAPFAVATDFIVSQAFPEAITHTTPDSYYAVDFDMPIGTDIYAARGGVVFDVASTNFRGGLDPAKDLPAANLIRILHDDGTIAIYAHLNWNTIRVQPGDRVKRGEYIADSGNTGFSSGPHLHFVVLQNRGLRLESLPVAFDAPNGTTTTAKSGAMLSAY